MSNGNSRESDDTARKTLVLYDDEPDPPGRLGITILFVLFFASVLVLGTFYDLPTSRFPYHEAGYYEAYDVDYDRSGPSGVPSGKWEWSPGGSSALIYRGLIPAVLLVCFSFQVGRGCVVGRGRDVSWVFGLGCICLIGYCCGWLIEGQSTLWAMVRIAAFVVAVASLVCSWLVTFAIMGYSKRTYQDLEGRLLMQKYANAQGNHAEW